MWHPFCFITGDNSETEAVKTATTFNADAHIKLFEKTFDNLNIKQVKNLAIAKVADSTNLNPAIAWKLDVHHIACRNHCLNPGCKDMENNCKELASIAAKTQEIYWKVKASNKLSAELENVQAASCELEGCALGGICKLKLQAATRWNSLVGMLDSHVKAASGLCEVIQLHPQKDMSDKTTTVWFMRLLDHHLPYLNKLKQSSFLCKSVLQRWMAANFIAIWLSPVPIGDLRRRMIRGSTVCECLFNDYQMTLLYGTNITNTYWSTSVRIEPDRLKFGAYDSNADFINAVIKVQQHNENRLTSNEKLTIKPWKLPSDFDSEEELDEPLEDFESMVRDRHRIKKMMDHMPERKSDYDPALQHCVLGSAAEVERVWSMADHVLTEHCASLSPLVFELIMYLKYNSRLWGLAEVMKANKNRKDLTQAGVARCAIQNKVDEMKNKMNNWDKTIDKEWRQMLLVTYNNNINISCVS